MRKIIVTDIDDTVTMSNVPTAWVLPNACMKEYLDKKDRDRYEINYVTARPRMLENMTKDWLKKYAFPQLNNISMEIMPKNERYEKLIEICKPSRGQKQKNDCIFIDDNIGSVEFIKDRIESLYAMGIGIRIYSPRQCKAILDGTE